MPSQPTSTRCSNAPTPQSSSAIPPCFALEERNNRLERTGEELVYHDLAHEWRSLTGLVFVSAIWGAAHGSVLDESIAEDFIPLPRSTAWRTSTPSSPSGPKAVSHS
jgi:hypothetical protein